MVKIDYQCGIHGKHEVKTIEPYKLDEGGVFGYDIEHDDGIRRYRMDRISRARIPHKIRGKRNTFKPRGEIEITKEEEHGKKK
jgi:predicted DNA-binding transcriptional regulator YafY